MTKIKICGLTCREDVLAVNRCRPDYAGFVFAASKRQVSSRQAEALSRLLHPDIVPVGVFVNAEEPFICSLAEKNVIRAVQLHGSESPEMVSHLRQQLSRLPGGTKIPIIKAVTMKPGCSLDPWQASAADFLLLDKGAGGTGEAFDHRLLEGRRSWKKPWFLAGGMMPETAPELIRQFHPFGVDVSSGVETEGRKDEKKIFRMVENVRLADEEQ